MANAEQGSLAAGVVGLAVPMLKSFAPSARARAAGAPVEVDISKLEPGQMMTVEWRGKPVWLVNRTPEALASLATVEEAGLLADPLSEMPQQPEYAVGVERAIKPEPVNLEIPPYKFLTETQIVIGEDQESA